MKKLLILLGILTLALGLYAAPLNEGFESTTCPADGWTISYANPSPPSGNTITHTTSYYYSGSRSFRFSSYSSGSPYDQYLVTPELSVTEGDQTVSFWYRKYTSGSETFRVGWSSTGTATTDFTWTDDITTASTTWQQYTKTDLPVGTKYVALHYKSIYAYYLYVDDFVGPEVYVAPVPPNPAVVGAPADLATNVGITPTLSWSSGGGYPTGYDVYFGETLPAEGSPNVSHDVQTTTSWTPPALDYSTTYSWKIVPWNAYGGTTFASCPTWTFTTMDDPVIYVGPENSWVEDFGTTASFPPINWTRLTGLYPSDTPVSTATYWTYDDFANVVTTPMNNSGRLNVFSTSTKHWLVTPPIAIPDAGYELKFDLALTTYSGVGSPTPGSQSDDKFMVFIDDDPMMSSPTLLKEWNNSGSSFVYDTISNTGETHIIDLDGYPGVFFLAFYGESTSSGGDNNIYVDNVTVRETPLLPIISVTPDSWDFGTQLINTTTSQSFTIANDGGAPLSLNSVNVTGTGFALSEAFSSITLQPLENTTITVNFSPLTEATYSGNIVISDNRAPTNIPLTGAAIDATIYSGDLPHIENFDSVTAPDLPQGWSKQVNTSSTSYDVVTYTSTSPNSPPNHVRMYCYNSADELVLISPIVDPNLNTLRVKFMAKHGSTSTSLIVGTMDGAGSRAVFTPFQTVPLTSSYSLYTVNFADYVGTDEYIAFKLETGASNAYRYIYIDDVVIEVPAPIAPEPANLVWPLNGITTLLNPLLTWTPSATGEPVTSYKVYMNDSGTFSESDMIYEGTDTQFQTADMGYERNYYWKVLPINANGSDPTCPTWSFSTPLESQLAEGFEATAFPPAGWQRTTSSTSYWGRSTTSPLEGAAGMYAYTSTSTVYTISSPMLTITSSSSLDFFAKVTDVTQKLQILESTDRVNWTQVGADITFATANVWNPISVNLSVIEPGNYYLAFSSPVQTTGYKYIYVDHIIGPNITPVVPGAPTLAAPADAAEDQSNYPSFTWTAPTTGGIPTGYNFYLDTVDGSTLYASNVTSPYFPTTALDWEETYYWTVKAFNDAGTGEAPVARSFTVMSDPTIVVGPAAPWSVDFGTLSGDWPVTYWSQLHGFYPTPIGTTAQWFQDDWLNVTTPANKAAKINIYGPTRFGWLVTPPISIPANGYELKFDVALLDWNGTVPPVAGEQADDKFIVVMSDTPIMSNPTILREWNNDESPYVFDAISHTGSSVTIPLAGVTGTKYFAFYAESSVSGGDNDLMVDNVLIREAPTGVPNPVTLTSPADDADNLPIDGFNLTWSPDNTGATATNFFVLMGSTDDTNNMEYFWELSDVNSFDPTQAAEDPITFSYGDTWYWTVIASNGEGDSTTPTPFSFTIMDDPRVLSLPYSQNFDGVTAPNLPAQWVGMLNPTSTSWYVDTYSSTTYAVSQPNTARMYNSSSTTADIRLITPEILVPMNSIKLSFSARGSSGYTLLVGTTNATDATGVFNQLASITLTATHTIYTVSLADYAGSDQYICFKHGLGGTYRTIYIDDVNMEMLTPYDLAVTDFAGDSYGLAGDQLSYTVTVTNNGTAAQNSYSVQLLSQTRDVLATLNVSESLEPGASAQHIINWTPSIADTYDVYAKVILAGDANPTNDESYLITVAIFSVTSFTPLVGNIASATSTTSIPFHMYWKNNVAETIYMAHEMQMVSGTINAIVYHNNFTQNINVPVKVWMKHTTESINAAWLPFDDYTLVYDGNIFFPAGVNPIVIPLQTPFQYTGGNLAIRTNRVMDTRDYGNSEKYFYTTDNMNPNRTRYYQADSSVIDPANPGLTNAGTQSSMIPNTGFIVDPYVALPAPSAPVVQIAMSGTNPQLSWNAVDNAYVYAIYGSDDPYDWSAESEIATTSGLTYNIASPTAKKFYKVVARTYGHQDRSLGIVLNPASVIGFDNSSVKRMLPTINTENKD